MKELIIEDFKEWGVKVDMTLYIPYFNLYLSEFNITTKNKLGSFFGNLLHESASFRYVKEILPKNNPEYLKRLGNYFGRAFLQITHKYNYKAFTDWCKINIKEFDNDFVKNPELLETPQYAVLSAFWYWEANNLNKYAENDFINVCSIINTGRVQNPSKPHKINGIDDRINKFNIISKWCDKNKII